MTDTDTIPVTVHTTTVATPPTLSSVANIPTEVTLWLSGLVEATHKQFAALWVILATAGVVGTPAGSKGGYVLLGYAALAHIAENLFKKA